MKQIRPGGLMRCCLATLDKAAEQPDFTEAEGTLLKCAHCPSTMRVRADAWEWAKDLDDVPPDFDISGSLDELEH